MTTTSKYYKETDETEARLWELEIVYAYNRNDVQAMTMDFFWKNQNDVIQIMEQLTSEAYEREK